MFRVLHVDTANEWRGGQVQLLHLVVGMRKRGWPVSVACPEGSPLWNAVKEAGVETVSVPVGRSMQAARKISQWRPDLVAAHTSHAHTCCLLLRQPLVVHRRVDFVPSGGWKYRRPDGYVSVSRAVGKIVAEAGGRNVLVVHDGVTGLPDVLPCPDGPTVLAVGARVPHKGHRVLAAAAALMPEVDIGVAGDGPLTYPGIRWLGHRTDIAALHAAARVFVHPSIEEGMGQSVVEAMLSGVPVVCSDAGGLPEVVGDCGIVVPAGDARALAMGIQRALRGEHPPTALAKQHALDLFGVDLMVENTIRAYQLILGDAQ